MKEQSDRRIQRHPIAPKRDRQAIATKAIRRRAIEEGWNVRPVDLGTEGVILAAWGTIERGLKK